MNVKRSVSSWLLRSLVLCAIGLLSFSMQGQSRQSPQRMRHHVPQVVANGKAPLGRPSGTYKDVATHGRNAPAQPERAEQTGEPTL